MNKKYPAIDSNQNFAELENKIQNFWQENNIFQKTIDNRKDQEEFVFYDGPPFANGLPHYGHLLTGFVKDIFARYQTMIGKKTERKFGWDTHGLPVEMEVEKELKLSGKIAIENYGIDKFNDACQKSVMKYSNDWQEYVTKQARWVDFAGGYKTMDLKYMESVLASFKALYKKGLLYEDMRVMPYSWVCQTPLSNFETKLDNSYREKESKAITLTFSLNEEIQNIKNLHLLIWTTTAWTLPSNLAIAVGSEIDYLIFEQDGKNYIIAKKRLAVYKKDFKNLNILLEIKGQELVGKTYQPVFSCLKNATKLDYDLKNAFQVFAGDFVTTEDGTGIVHMAPGFGEDDQILCKAKGIPTISPVDDAGKFTYPVEEFLGRQVFDCNIDIIKKLKEQGNWIKTEQYLHNYPHCWRSDTPLIYKALPSWYVKVTDIKDRMVELNQEINWIPEHIKNGSFGKWLEGARDWSISRNRFWGCPVPVWKSNDPEYPNIDVYGSIAEMEKDFGTKIDNLHRPYIDKLTRKNPNDPTGKSMMVRVSDVLDCWFESGSMPYAQNHYDFSKQDLTKDGFYQKNFTADFIVEYNAQTRGWFYTLMVLSTALFDKVPFKNCICHGVILDEKSQKLSKRLKNYTSPLIIFEKYGADAMRFFMCASSVMRGNELNIDREGDVFKNIVRLYIKPIWNSYNFFTLYANADQIEAEFKLDSKNIMDKYILSKTKDMIETIKIALDKYDLPNAYNEIKLFFEVLNNWYIRRSRKVFWQKEKNREKIDAYNSLYSVLYLVIRAIAPLVPYLSEEIFLGMVNNEQESVHLTEFPEKEIARIKYDSSLVADMDRVQDICNIALSIRSKKNIRIRQPLSSITIIDKKNLKKYQTIIADEINVKKVIFEQEIGDLAELKLDLNFKLIGARLGSKIKKIIPLAKQGKWQKTDDGIKIADILLEKTEYILNLKPKDETNMRSLSSQDALVALDLNLDDDLKQEGIARDIVRIIQQMRKDQDLEITQRISLEIFLENEFIKSSIKNFEQYIKEQVLADNIDFVQNRQAQKHKILEEEITITFIKYYS